MQIHAYLDRIGYTGSRECSRENLALEIADTWLSTEFSGEARHQRRIDKVMDLEK